MEACNHGRKDVQRALDVGITEPENPRLKANEMRQKPKFHPDSRISIKEYEMVAVHAIHLPVIKHVDRKSVTKATKLLAQAGIPFQGSPLNHNHGDPVPFLGGELLTVGCAYGSNVVGRGDERSDGRWNVCARIEGPCYLAGLDHDAGQLRVAYRAVVAGYVLENADGDAFGFAACNAD